MQVGVVLERLTPGVEYRDEADFRPEVAGIGGDGLERPGGGSRSAWRASSQAARARAWHFGQCRFRQEL
jgi:hypothetical protein